MDVYGAVISKTDDDGNVTKFTEFSVLCMKKCYNVRCS